MLLPSWSSHLLLLAAAIGLAQTSAGSITGTVSDGNTVLANFPVQVTNSTTGVVYRATSSADGRYTIGGLTSGQYRLLASRPIGPGVIYVDYRRTVVIDESRVLPVDIHLERFGGGALTRARERLGLPQPPSGPPSRTPDGKPDLSGVWLGVVFSEFETPELLDAAAAIAEERLGSHLSDHPASRCLPSGVGPQSGLFWYKFVQTPSLMVMLFEDDVRTYREIYLDGRVHPPNPIPSWLGHSIARWDGDSLVVDTVGYNGRVWLDIPRRHTALPSTEKLHVIERYRRTDQGHLALEVTIDDPGAYRKTWTAKGASELAVGLDLQENICNENNRSVEHLVGK